MSEKTYKILSYVQRIALPALATFLTTVLGLCGVGGETIALVVGIVTAVDVFMGALLKVEYDKWATTQTTD